MRAWTMASAVALVGVAFLIGGARAEAPAPAAAPVTIQLEVIKPLALVEWVARGQKAGTVTLDGELRARIANPGEAPVTLRRLEVHGLVFTDEVSGDEHVVVHPCQCVKDATDKKEPTLVVPPGGEVVVALDEWGCSSAWTPPPPGRYAVRYRVLPAEGAARRRVDPTRPPNEVVAACRARLQAPETWLGAVRSEPLKVQLKKPKRKRL